MKYLNFTLVLFCMLFSGSLYAESDIDVVKRRVVAEILQTEVDDDLVSKLIQSLKEDGSWSGINYTDLSLTGFQNGVHLKNLETFSLAYRQNSSSYYHSPDLLERIIKSLRFWCERDFISDNWHDNQVSTPRRLVNVLLLLEDHIEPGLRDEAVQIIGRANLNAPGARPGADRTKIGEIAAKKGLVVGDDKAFGEILRVLSEQIRFNTGGRGIQVDYSFHHRYDRVNTTYSYGTAYADALARWAAFVAGTSYAFTPDRLEQLTDYYLDGICKQAVYGIYLEKGAMNRGISRKEIFNPISTATPENLLIASDYRKGELEEIMGLRRAEISPSASFAKFFWQSEHFVFQRPGFYTTVRMFSIRNQNMEYPHNSEGVLNHHRGDGTNHLSVRGSEYLNIWPVYDWQKIPGTTVLQKPALPPANQVLKPGVTDFVGAVCDGRYGAVCFDFISPIDLTRARKGWFFFDEEYVCLGAGIESPTRTLPLVTTTEQVLLQGEVIVSNGRDVDTLDRGIHEIKNVDWIIHNGTGYRFPDSTTVHLSNREESGRWTDISKQYHSPKELVTEDVFKLWIDHGVRPQGNIGQTNYASTIPKDVKYQYMVVPVATPGQMNDDRDIEVLVNNRKIQAVKDHESGRVQAIFYHAGEINISEGMLLSVDSPGAVMLKLNNGEVKEITVADPSRRLNRIHIQITGMDKLAIELPGGIYAGQSVDVEL
ncbi:MAG: chondroitin lyase [Bacteroidetes bacterium]|nr:chondroitin lyase [Bacteroidota bacterium]